MKEYLRLLFIKLFNPKLYYIEKNSFVGDSIKVVSDVATPLLSYKDVYILKSSAQKEILKSIIPIPEGNYKLLREIEKAGIQLDEYQKTIILEDGEDSELYQSLVVKNEA